MKTQGRFFTKEQYENELCQSVNKDVLRRIKKDSAITKDEMIFSFYFITDTRAKIEALIDYLRVNEANQQIEELNQTDDDLWELTVRSYPIKLEIEQINHWERKMWDIGYQFDCELDGWQTS